MNDFIINAPQLQSLHKRLSGLFAWAVCWLMWIYFLIPLITLTSWLMGDNSLTNEMRWFGGYKSLLELMEIYVITLLVLAFLWLCWVCYHSQRKQPILAAAQKIVTDNDLTAFYLVDHNDLKNCRNAQLTTVYFDDHGQITKLQAECTEDKQVLKAVG
jgi:biofilm PGA synthesis protein PgaD